MVTTFHANQGNLKEINTILNLYLNRVVPQIKYKIIKSTYLLCLFCLWLIKSFLFCRHFFKAYITLELATHYLLNTFKNMSFSVSFQRISNENTRFTVVWPWEKKKTSYATSKWIFFSFYRFYVLMFYEKNNFFYERTVSLMFWETLTYNRMQCKR